MRNLSSFATTLRMLSLTWERDSRIFLTWLWKTGCSIPLLMLKRWILITKSDLILLQNDEELKGRLKKSYQDFWLQEKLNARYPAFWSKVQPYFVEFPTSYLVERGFSAVSLLLTKQRQKLQLNKRGDLRLFLTKITPSIKMLVENHQAQGSH